MARDTSGSVLSEYSFLTSLVAAVAAFGMIQIGLELHDHFAQIGTLLADASSNLPVLW